MSNTTTGNVTVNYALTAGTATSGVDYTYTGGIATIVAGSTTATINVSTLQDTIFEGSETFNIVLSSPSSNATISDGTGAATITDNDSAPAITVNDISITE